MYEPNFKIIETPNQVLFVELVQAALQKGFYILFAYYDHPLDQDVTYVAYMQKPVKSEY